MIVLVTDFGNNGPYAGQMKAAIYQVNPAATIVDLFANAPGFNPRACSYLLSAHRHFFRQGAIFVCIVDPGVGSDQRKPVVAEVDGQFFVGPNNGLFDVVLKQSNKASIREILWRPSLLSATFHGRDLFAPIAAHLSLGGCPDGYLGSAGEVSIEEVPGDLFEVVYIDDYGNAVTGIRACSVAHSSRLQIKGFELSHAQIFAAVSRGEIFWYENSVGLVEIAINCGNAAAKLGLAIGDMVKVAA